MNYDGCLFLGCLLGIIVLEPPLIQMAAGWNDGTRSTPWSPIVPFENWSGRNLEIRWCDGCVGKEKIHARKISNSWFQLKSQRLFQTSKLTFFLPQKNAAPISPNHPEMAMHRWYDLRFALRLWGSSLATVVRPLGFWTARCFLPRCFSV